MSHFTWLDHSDRERRKMLDAIDRFKETETRDELGLGSIRDVLADLFFPGTSTVQTRARYFLFVPWMYVALEKKRIARDAIVARARKEELRLVAALLDSDDTDGAFGKIAGATLKRLPSNIYWQGLGAWGIRLTACSWDDYHRGFGELQRRALEAPRDDDGDLVHGGARRSWHASIPEPPDEFPEDASFDLRFEDADYLRERITLSAPQSLLAFLVRRGRTLDADYPWSHPQYGEFSAEIRGALDHARLLAETMHGAALLYNLMLAEELPARDGQGELVGEYRSRLQAWCEELSPRRIAIREWDRPGFWRLVEKRGPMRGSTKQFVERWIALAPWASLAQTTDNAAARGLIRERERQLKRGRARLGNPRALELWKGEAGTARLSYRWGAARRILTDLHAGLAQEDADA